MKNDLDKFIFLILNIKQKQFTIMFNIIFFFDDCDYLINKNNKNVLK